MPGNGVGGNADLFVMRADGSANRPLHSDPGLGQRARLGTGTPLIVRPRASHPARNIADHEWPRRCGAFARSDDYDSNLHPANATALSPSDRCGGAERFLAALATDEEEAPGGGRSEPVRLLDS